MLLDKGLIRVGIGIPADAEFELIATDDPYGYAHAGELSLFRRPLPSANLKFLSTVMWDGRETFKDPASKDCILGTATCFASMHFDLDHQAGDATTGHAQAPLQPSVEQREAIIAFESALFTAQIFDDMAGHLTARGGLGGPKLLSGQDFYFGINDVVSNDYRSGALFDANVFHLYDRWERGKHSEGGPDDARRVDARAAVFRGQTLFNTKQIGITGVSGLNDDLGIPALDGTCTTCHDTPHAGNHSIPAPLDIGLADASRRTPDLPLYTLRNRQTLQTVQTTDPGRALVTGKWKDIGRFKGPILRALAARAPYFHNGSARDLRGGRRLLRRALRYRSHRPGEARPDRVPASALNVLLEIGPDDGGPQAPVGWMKFRRGGDHAQNSSRQHHDELRPAGQRRAFGAHPLPGG